MTTARSTPARAGLVLLVAGAAVESAVQVHRAGHEMLGVLVAALAAGLLVWAVPRDARLDVERPGNRRAVLAILALHVVGLAHLVPDVLDGAAAWQLVLAAGASVVAVALAVDQLSPRPRTGATGRAGLVLALAVLGLVWLAVQDTTIDVVAFQRVGADRLLDGINPYLPGYPNPYPPAETQAFYGDGLATADVLRFGFPYPPASLLASTVGAVLGDVRIAHLLASLAAGWLLLTMVAESWSARVGGVLLLTSPLLLPVVQRSWTEPFLVLALVATLWLAGRGSRAAPVALGLLVAVKQYAVLMLPVLLAIAPLWRTGRTRWRAARRALVVAVAVTAPLAVWDLGEFFFSVVVLHLRQPFRADALTVPAALSRWWDVPGEPVALAGTAVAVALTLWWTIRRARRTWSATATAVATVTCAFLLFDKQAFINYYLVVAAAIWLAVATIDAPLDDDPAEQQQGRRAPELVAVRRCPAR